MATEKAAEDLEFSKVAKREPIVTDPQPQIPSLASPTSDNEGLVVSPGKRDTPADLLQSKHAQQSGNVENIVDSTQSTIGPHSTTTTTTIPSGCQTTVSGDGATTWRCDRCDYMNFSAGSYCGICGEVTLQEKGNGDTVGQRNVDTLLDTAERGGVEETMGIDTLFSHDITPLERTTLQTSVIREVSELTSHDILLAAKHGRDFQHYAGNIKLAKVVLLACRRYRSSCYKKRAAMIPAIVKLVKQWDPPGRFLKLDPASSEWIEVPDDYASLHVLQLFLRHTPDEKQAVFMDDKNQRSSSITNETSVTVWDLDDSVKEAGDDGAVAITNTLDATQSRTMTNLSAAAASLEISLASEDNTSAHFETIPTGPRDCGSGQDRSAYDTAANLHTAMASLGAEESTHERDQFQLSSPESGAQGRAPLPDAKRNETARPNEEAGWQNGNQQPSHNTEIVARIIWQIRWGHTSDATKYYEANRILLTDAGKHEVWFNAHRHLDSRMVPRLFPGLTPPPGILGTPSTVADGNQTPAASHPQRQMRRLPGKHDVLCGLGYNMMTNNSEGNVLFRKIAETRRAEYATCRTWKEKMAISKELVGQWRSLDPPGRFLEADGFGLWNDIGDAKARRRTSYLLRAFLFNPGQIDLGYESRPGLKAFENPQHSKGETVGLGIDELDPYGSIPVDHFLYLRDKALFSKWATRGTTDSDDKATERDACFKLSNLRDSYDDAVVDVAMYNYESFHGLEHGTAAFGDVASTSAGINGWAACTIQEEQDPPISEDDQTDEECTPRPDNPKKRSDPEEDRQLQIALLESIGACPRRLDVCEFSTNDSSCSEGEWSDSDYDYDEEEEEEEDEEEDREEDQGNLEDREETQVEDAMVSSANSQDTASVPRKVDKSSCQFQQLTNQVDEETAAMDTGTKNAPSAAQATANSDGESWSQVSSATSGSSSAVLVDNKEDNGGTSRRQDQTDEEWQCLQEGAHKVTLVDGCGGAEDDWSEVSNDESSQKDN